MAEYIDRTKIPWVKTDNPKGKYWDRIVCESTIKNMKQADVIERYKIDKAIAEIETLKKYEMERFSEDVMYHKALKECLEIIKRNIGE